MSQRCLLILALTVCTCVDPLCPLAYGCGPRIPYMIERETRTHSINNGTSHTSKHHDGSANHLALHGSSRGRCAKERARNVDVHDLSKGIDMVVDSSTPSRDTRTRYQAPNRKPGFRLGLCKCFCNAFFARHIARNIGHLGACCLRSIGERLFVVLV